MAVRRGKVPCDPSATGLAALVSLKRGPMRSVPNILALALLPACAPSSGNAETAQEVRAEQAAPPASPRTVEPSADGAKLTKACKGRDGWAEAAPPAKLFGNTWYVGTCGISAILVTGTDGHVLIDGGLPEAAPLVLANIAAAGFKARDVRWILSSHEHFDHAGALAALQRAIGARVAALPAAAQVLETGEADPEDPQFGGLDAFPAVRVDRHLADGEHVAVGKLSLTAHATLAHAAGSTSWTWRACDEQKQCLTVAYADSASAISAKGYRFTDHPARVEAVRNGLDRIATLPCDLLVTPHPGASDLFARLSGAAPLVDPAACRTYAATAKARFETRLSEETAPEAKEIRS